MKVERVRPEFVEEFPTSMESGVLYVSVEYNTCGHLCACGCGDEVMTPLSPAQWAMTYDGRDVSLWPSVGSWALPCRSHYVLDRGRVRWARTFTDAEIDRNRARDRRALTNGGDRRISSQWLDDWTDDLDDFAREDDSDAMDDGSSDDLPTPEAAAGWWRRVATKLRRG